MLGEMPGAYTRSKMLAEQLALQAAASGFPVVIASPTRAMIDQSPPVLRHHFN
jgi:thioester reductase-like protein